MEERSFFLERWISIRSSTPSVHFQTTSLSSIHNADSPSPISSQNSVSGDENNPSNRHYQQQQQQQQQQQKKKGIRNSLGRLFTRKNDLHDQKASTETNSIIRGKVQL